MGRHDQEMRSENIAAIANYYRSGIKDTTPKIGIEIEHTLVYPNGSQVPYEGDCGAQELLKKLAGSFPEPMCDGNNIIGMVGKDKTVTLEPAAQVELSAGPFDSLFEAKKCIDNFESELLDAGKDCGIKVLTPGYHPTMRAIDLKIIPKKRYAIMNEYLGAISMFGICMMRGSASTQISIDYTSEKDCLQKLRLSNACVPIFSLICDNSPIFEAKPRTHNMVRTKIWQKCDPDRCGIVPKVMDKNFSLDAYAAYILDTPALVAKIDDIDKPCKKTFGELFADKVMSTDDIEHALSMFFNDVRLKRYIEIRPADAMPSEYVVAYAALIKGLFYNANALSQMELIFDNVSNEDIADAKTILMQKGYASDVYGSPVSEIADELISIAASSLSEEEKHFIAPIAELVEHRKTLADIAEMEHI
ncbi:glutamate-cysteine ligase family protein [Adlercreutzia sp. ZJ154]|uniref:glutamate-cysteine ligase family protein n=1 Tax=Adlercreutzia sp. ZJ154 TaxID=2709790 RepID=UPI0013EC4721|nr:glutamate-cysteine ligase family protein [Adlercreutzia sp. ZJ154]